MNVSLFIKSFIFNNSIKIYNKKNNFLPVTHGYPRGFKGTHGTVDLSFLLSYRELVKDSSEIRFP